MSLLVRAGAVLVLAAVGCDGSAPKPPTDPPEVAAAEFVDATLSLNGEDATKSELTFTPDAAARVSGSFRLADRTDTFPRSLMAKVISDYPAATRGRPEKTEATGSLELSTESDPATFEGELDMPKESGRYELRITGVRGGGTGDLERLVIIRAIVQVEQAPEDPEE